LVGKLTELNASLAKAQETIQAITALKKGERAVILWHDACRVTNDPDIRAEYYSTPKETQGTIFDCLPDPEYPSVFYLILWGETTGGRPDYYDAIPIAWISKIQTLTPTAAAKFPRRALKEGVVGERLVRRVLQYRKGQLVEDSGGAFKAALRYIGYREPLKFVEEIYKNVA
jgi:hypothetical protein